MILSKIRYAICVWGGRHITAMQNNRHGKFYPLGKNLYAEILIYYDCKYNLMRFKVKQ